MRSAVLLFLCAMLLAGCSQPGAVSGRSCPSSGLMMEATVPAVSTLVSGNASWVWGAPRFGLPMPGDVGRHGPGNVTAFLAEGQALSLHSPSFEGPGEDGGAEGGEHGAPGWRAYGTFDDPMVDNGSVRQAFQAFAGKWVDADHLEEAAALFASAGTPVRAGVTGSGPGGSSTPGPITGWSYAAELPQEWISGADLSGDWRPMPTAGPAGKVSLQRGSDIIAVDVGEWATVQQLADGGHWWAIVDADDRLFMVILPAEPWSTAEATAFAKPVFGIGGDWGFPWRSTGGQWCKPPAAPPRVP